MRRIIAKSSIFLFVAFVVNLVFRHTLGLRILPPFNLLNSPGWILLHQSKAAYLLDIAVILIISIFITFILGKIKGRRLILKEITSKVSEGEFLFLLFFLFLVYALIGMYFKEKAVPNINHETGYLFQAKLFSTGRLYAEVPQFKYHFCNYTDIVKDGKWFSKYFPGYPLILSLGVLVGQPWITNPIFCTLSLIMIFFLCKELYGRKVAFIVTILGFFSTYLFKASTNFFDDATNLFFSLLFLFFFQRMVKRGMPRDFLFTGLSVGMMGLIRPLTAVFFSLPFLCYLLYLIIKGRVSLQKFIRFCIGPVFFLSLLLFYQWQVTGNPLSSTYIQPSLFHDFNKLDYPGFHMIPMYGLGTSTQVHTPMKGLENIRASLVWINRLFFRCPFFLLLFIIIPFLFIKKNKWDFLIITSILSLIFATFIHYGVIARYLFLAYPGLLMLAARGITNYPALLNKFRVSNAAGVRFTIAFVIMCFLFIFPRMIETVHISSKIPKNIVERVNEKEISNAVVFVSSNPKLEFYRDENGKVWCPTRHRADQINLLKTLYSVEFYMNSPDLDGDILYARDLGRLNQPLMKHYSDREFYSIEYDLINHEVNIDKIDTTQRRSRR